ncbi:MAG: hypothetical protein IEMM0002_1311 [bacterium]|nr:MAG: hypothetical protein IEMM0002_1311 [bacterium]
MRSGKIFIIEDAFTKQVALIDLLKKENLGVITGGGEDVMDQIVQAKPAIVLTDIDKSALPETQMGFLQKLKENEALKSTEVFVYLESLNVSIEVQLRKMKLNNYFIKDTNTDFIVSSIKQFFEPQKEDDFSLVDATPRYNMNQNTPRPMPAVGPVSTPPVDERQNIGEMMKEFSDKIHSQLGEGDAETFYNLGISYMDMELYVEAIGEFEKAAANGQFRLEASNMIGKCLCSQKKYGEAIEKFKETAKFTSDKVEMMGVKYEIGITLEEMGKLKEAFNTLGSIYKEDKSYRDVLGRLKAIKKKLNG